MTKARSADSKDFDTEKQEVFVGEYSCMLAETAIRWPFWLSP